jgi:hypothetical protein
VGFEVEAIGPVPRQSLQVSGWYAEGPFGVSARRCPTSLSDAVAKLRDCIRVEADLEGPRVHGVHHATLALPLSPCAGTVIPAKAHCCPGKISSAWRKEVADQGVLGHEPERQLNNKTRNRCSE